MSTRKKYNSKYGDLTPEERKQKYRESAREWKKRMGIEKQYSYLRGHCDACNGDFTNIYEHRKSLRHKNKVIEQQMNNKVVPEQISIEDQQEIDKIENSLKT